MFVKYARDQKQTNEKEEQEEESQENKQPRQTTTVAGNNVISTNVINGEAWTRGTGYRRTNWQPGQ